MAQDKYLLLTPAKDEAGNMNQLRQTVEQQTVKPSAWVIIDSGSRDDTYRIAESFSSECDWIYVIRQKRFWEAGYGHLNFAQAINEGFEYATNVIAKKEECPAYVGKVDADVLLSKDYFEILLREINVNERIGIVCGMKRTSQRRIGIVAKKFADDRFAGFSDIRLYRTILLQEMGGYPLTHAPDTVLQIKAMQKGWECRLSSMAYYTETREGGSKTGMWNGFVLKGITLYELGYHPILVLMNAVYQTIRYPFRLQGLPLVAGYLAAMAKRRNRIDDKEIIDYFWNIRYREILASLGIIIRERDHH